MNFSERDLLLVKLSIKLQKTIDFNKKLYYSSFVTIYKVDYFYNK